MTLHSSLQQLSNSALLDETTRLAARERSAAAALIAAIAEVDQRRLYLGEGCSSMFAYCTRVLHLSEHAAYDRIEVARLSRRFPVVLDHVESGAVTLTNVRLLAPHLTNRCRRSFVRYAVGDREWSGGRGRISRRRGRREADEHLWMRPREREALHRRENYQ